MITLLEKEFNRKNYRLAYEDSFDGPYLFVRFDFQKNENEWEIKVGHQVEYATSKPREKRWSQFFNLMKTGIENELNKTEPSERDIIVGMLEKLQIILTDGTWAFESAE